MSLIKYKKVMQYPRNLLVKNNQSLQIKIEKEKLTDEVFYCKNCWRV